MFLSSCFCTRVMTKTICTAFLCLYSDKRTYTNQDVHTHIEDAHRGPQLANLTQIHAYVHRICHTYHNGAHKKVRTYTR